MTTTTINVLPETAQGMADMYRDAEAGYRANFLRTGNPAHLIACEKMRLEAEAWEARG